MAKKKSAKEPEQLELPDVPPEPVKKTVPKKTVEYQWVKDNDGKCYRVPVK